MHWSNSCSSVLKSLHHLRCTYIVRFAVSVSFPPPLLSHVQCAGVNGDNYQGAFSEPVSITVEPPEPQEGIV